MWVKLNGVSIWLPERVISRANEGMQKVGGGVHAEIPRQVALDFNLTYYQFIVRFDEQKILFKIRPASRDRADALANLPLPARWSPRKRDVAVPATKRDLSHTSALLGVEPKEGFHMKSDLAIATLIRSRMTELGLSRGEFVKRLGYKNIAKGIRRIDALCGGDIEGTKRLDVLPQALETSAQTVKLAFDQTVHERRIGSETRSRNA